MSPVTVEGLSLSRIDMFYYDYQVQFSVPMLNRMHADTESVRVTRLCYAPYGS